jgi:hypothetical protein
MVDGFHDRRDGERFETALWWGIALSGVAALASFVLVRTTLVAVVPPPAPAPAKGVVQPYFDMGQVREAARLVQERLGKNDLELVGFQTPKQRTTTAHGKVTAIRVTLRGEGADQSYWALLRDGALLCHFPDPPESEADKALKAEVEAADGKAE